MPCAVFRPAMTAPGTSSEGLKSSEMYLRFLETAPIQRMSWLPGMTRHGAISPRESRYALACVNSRFVHRWVRSPEMSMASGPSPSRKSLKASSRSETAGRPKWRSETCTRVVTTRDSTRTRRGWKPASSRGRRGPRALQKLRERLVEPSRILQVREVADVRQGDVVGVRNTRGHLAHDRGGGDLVLRAAHDEGRDVYPFQGRRRVRALAHGPQGGDGAVRRVLQYDRAHPLDEALVLGAGLGGEQALHLEVDEHPDALLRHPEGHLLAGLPRLLGVGVGARVRQHQAGDPLRERPHALKRHVPAHRDAA